MKKPSISIIVPIYKVENYLERCVESLLNQTLTNIEVILVNDGSPDRCPEICDNYERIDSRVKVIHKENGGLSDARNMGLKLAQGDYILFVDSDDYIEINACEKLLSYINKEEVDIVVGNANRIEENKRKELMHSLDTNKNCISGKEYLKNELKSKTMFVEVWLNLYSRKFLIINNLYFEKGLLHEDEEFTPRVFLKAQKVVGTKFVFYNYLIRKESITTSKNKLKNAEHVIKTCKKLEKLYEKIEDKELRKLLLNNLVEKILYIFQITELYEGINSNLINKNLLIGKSCTIKNKLKVSLFIFNKKVYFNLNKFLKK